MNRVKFIIGILVIMFVLAGCKKNSEKQITGWDESGRAAAQQNQIQDIREELSESCRDIYVQSKESGALGSLETIQRMVSRIGEAGYPVIDQYNQTDMENAHLAEIFCKKVNEKQAAGLKMIMVLNNGGFVYFNLNTADGKVEVSAASLSWKEDDLVNIGTDNYQAYTWVYSENGYLIFEKYYMQGFAGPYSHVAVRIKPLTNTCRELNRTYILPIGYGSNNLFITDWSEDDYRDLNFYDLYEIMYPLLFSTYAPYSSDYEGEVNQISQKEFEEVIRTYFDISSQNLQEKAIYDDHSRAYEYRPRGLYDSGSGIEIPYPEVVDYEYKDDGTIELTVNAVWPAMNLGTAFRHKVVIRPSSDSKFQYVSNQVIPSEYNAEPSWYTDRLSEEEIKGYNLPVDEEERKEAQADCNAAMESIKEIYEGADKGDSINVVISEEIISQMQEVLKATGCPVSTGLDYADMYNYEKMENFLMNSMEGKKGDIVTYEVYSSGRISRRKFIYDGADMYALSTDTAWNKENMPMITGTSKSRIKQWDYTDRGWFFYEYCVPEPPEVSEIIIGDTMLRVRPFNEEYRKLAIRYLQPLGYDGNNLLRSDWDSENLEGIDYNGLFEYLYDIKYQQPFENEIYKSGIPKEEFEHLMTEYLPVTAEKVRQYAVFAAESQTYEWIMLGCGNFVPSAFGDSIPEITGKKEHADDTVTWMIDAVSVYGGTAFIMSHQLTVRLLEDGGIRYLGNQILGDGAEAVPTYRYRLNIY